MTSRTIPIIFLAFISLSCASVSVKSFPALDDANFCAMPPSLTPGDYWVFERSGGVLMYQKFMSQEGDELIFKISGGRLKEEQFLHTSLSLVEKRMLDKNGIKIVWKRGERFGDYLQFPLWVGLEWEKSAFHNSDVIFTTAKVAAYEVVKTKAGSFESFRIEYQIQSQREPLFRYNYWFSPKAKNFVKIENLNQPELSRELVEIKLN